MSSLLTIYLTNSTTFVTRKESGVLRPDFSSPGKDRPSETVRKRMVMYYVSTANFLCRRWIRLITHRLPVVVSQKSKQYCLVSVMYNFFP